MKSLDPILARIRVRATICLNGHYCGGWAIDTSGTQRMAFHVVTHGQCYLKVEDRITQLNTGDAVFFPNDSKHLLIANPQVEMEANTIASRSMKEPMQDDTVALVCGHFEPQTPFFKSFSRYLPNVIIFKHAEGCDGSAIVDLLISEAKRANESSNALLDRFADCLFFLMLRDHHQQDDGLFAALLNPKLEKALQLIHESSSDTVTIDLMAQTAGMSRSAFATLFKETLEQSPKEYLTQWRMNQAYEWLAEDGISTFDAAIRSGYENEASFAKAFKRVIGMGPGAVRAK